VALSTRQLDLFSAAGNSAASHPIPAAIPPVAAPAELDDTGLLAAIPGSDLMRGPLLAAEAGRRKLAAAIPVLEQYCRRFAGFGTQHRLPEQAAALNALATIGGVHAAQAVGRIISSGWVQGPTLSDAVAAAAFLGSRLPNAVVISLLQNADPDTRANACRLARTGSETIATLIDLLGDLHCQVSLAAACALGPMGRVEAAPVLKRALRQAPSIQVIEAVPAIADEECVVLLGRIAQGASDLTVAAYGALEDVEHPLASRLLERRLT
jgi:hypothetical protein